jgi:hypothetical protein
MHTPINKDEFIVYYDKVIKLGTAISKSTQLSFATDDHNNNVLVKFSLAKYFKKFTYDDALNSNSLIGAFLYLCILGSISSGSTGTSNATLLAQCFIDNQWTYTDA